MTSNTNYTFDFANIDFIGGPYPGALSPISQGGGKQKKRMKTKKRGSSKRKKRRVSTLRKKRGSSKRKNRGSFKRRKYSKSEVVNSIMKGLSEKRRSHKKTGGNMYTSIYGFKTAHFSGDDTAQLKGILTGLNESEKKYLKDNFRGYRFYPQLSPGKLVIQSRTSDEKITSEISSDYNITGAPGNLENEDSGLYYQHKLYKDVQGSLRDYLPRNVYTSIYGLERRVLSCDDTTEIGLLLTELNEKEKKYLNDNFSDYRKETHRKGQLVLQSPTGHVKRILRISSGYNIAGAPGNLENEDSGLYYQHKQYTDVHGSLHDYL